MGYRIVVVDPDEMVCRFVRATLEPIGFEVFGAEGEDAMEVLERHPIDLVLAERGPSDERGLALLWCVKADYPDVAVVFMSTEDAFGFIVQAVRHGADDYLLKPFTAQALLAAIDRALSTRRPAARSLGPSGC
jgi:two-component system repressor protein LuxO